MKVFDGQVYQIELDGVMKPSPALVITLPDGTIIKMWSSGDARVELPGERVPHDFKIQEAALNAPPF